MKQYTGRTLEEVLNIIKYVKEKNIPFRLYLVTKDQFAQLEDWYPGRFEIEYNRDIADYVYESEKLATLAGKKLHANNFCKSP